MKLTDQELKDFRERALQASQYGHSIGLAELYTEALAAEVGQEEVPHGVTQASAAHLFDLADQALRQRAAGGEKAIEAPGKKGKKEKKVKSDPPPPPAEDPKPEVTGEAPVVEVTAEEPVTEVTAEEPVTEVVSPSDK